MQEAVPAGVGAMAALLKLPEGKLAGVLGRSRAGRDCRGGEFQYAGSGGDRRTANAVARAVELAKAAGARRAVLLQVSAPFHCPLMKPAQDRLKADLDATAVPRSRDSADQQLAGARDSHRRDEAREGLYQQVPNPVRWTESIRLLLSQGRDAIYRSGRGQRAALAWCATSIRRWRR